ncbi:MAG: hypothetical protein KIS96_14510 [Bauldia sp.]|nr:hypothetical protein [Bauldia sp.]
MPYLQVETDLCDLQGLIDAMLYMHEIADEGDRKRIMDAETVLLHLAREKTLNSISQINMLTKRSYERSAS